MISSCRQRAASFTDLRYVLHWTSSQEGAICPGVRYLFMIFSASGFTGLVLPLCRSLYRNIPGVVAYVEFNSDIANQTTSGIGVT